MRDKQILIAGYGYVGKAVHKLFKNVDVYDPYITGLDINIEMFDYEYCMVCASTPMNEDGSCNFSAIEDIVSKVSAEVFIIRSTMPPSALDKLRMEYGAHVVFQPEYVASSSPYPAPMDDIKKHPFIVLGGDKVSVKKVRRLYETVYPPTTRILETDMQTASVIKYAENCFIATKVTFCNELYNICEATGVDYDVVKEGVFDLDPRMNTWWTNIYKDNRGWGGHCLPKDVRAIIEESMIEGYNPLFLADLVFNNKRHKT